MMEQIMTDVQKANPDMNVILLRYFNPVGAHKSDISEKIQRESEQPDAIYFTGGSRKA